MSYTVAGNTTAKIISDLDIPLGKRVEYDVLASGLPLYMGINSIEKEFYDNDWTIVKYTYDAITNTTSILRQEGLIGAWNNRRTLAWTV